MKKVLEEKIGIPMGVNLRLLLNSEHISPGEINNVLKAKGIFIGSSDKSHTVPLLASMLLTPDDYDYLVSACMSRELRLKTKTATFKLVGNDADWATPLLDSLEERLQEVVAKFEDVEFISKPTLEFDGQKTARVQYEVRRKDISKEWIQREVDFQAKLEFTKVGDELDLNLYTSHTSKETEQINRSMTTAAAKLLHEARVTQSEEPQQIRFDSFDNNERVRFFKRLISGHSPVLGVGEVCSIEISLDPENASLPDDPQIAWMQGIVTRVEIDGDKMNNIFLISDERYYDYYHIQKMHVNYPFKDGPNEGKCRVTFNFSGQARSKEESNKRELTHLRGNIDFELRPNSEARNQVEKQIDKALRSVVEATFQRTLTDRTAALAAKAAGKAPATASSRKSKDAS